MAQTSNHQEEAASYGGQAYKPFEFDETVEPDFADGQYTAIISDVKYRTSNPDETGSVYPQLVLEWTAEETAEESQACQRSIGNTTSEFITFRPKGDRKGNMSKQRLTLLRNRFGIDTTAVPSRITGAEDFEELKAALKGQRTEVIATSKFDNRGAMRTNLQIVAVGGDEGEVEEEAPRAKPAAKKSAAPARKTARR